MHLASVVMAIAVRYVLPLVLCQLVVPVVMDFSREVTGARRLEMEDASAQGAMVISPVSSDLSSSVSFDLIPSW